MTVCAEEENTNTATEVTESDVEKSAASATVKTNEGDTVEITFEELIDAYDGNEASFLKLYQYAQIEFTGTIKSVKMNAEVIVDETGVQNGQNKITFEEGWCLVIGVDNTNIDLADFNVGDVVNVKTSIVGANYDTDFLQSVSENERVLWLVGNDKINSEGPFTDIVTTITTESSEVPLAAEEEFKIGDTVSTDRVEFTLLDFQLTSYASIELGDEYYMPVSDDYEGERVHATDGYVLAYLSYEFQNIGKTKLSGASRDLSGGGTMYGATGTHSLIDIDWNDGYLFQGIDYCAGITWEEDEGIHTHGIGYVSGLYGGNSISSDDSIALDVLTDARNLKCYFTLPSEVIEDEDTTLKVIIYLPYTEEDGSTWSTSFIYDIR